MDLLTELAKLNPDPALLAKAQDMVNQANRASLLELKNQKLTLELAHLKRLRFGIKSEALTAEQRSLFDDDTDQDLAAIEAEDRKSVV